MEKPVGKSIVIASKHIRRRVDALYFSKITSELNCTQSHLLGYLARNENATSADIQKDFRLSKSTVSELINSLVDSGYLTYEKSDGDARCRVIRLTEKTADVRERERAVLDEFETRLMEGISKEDLEAFYRVVNTLEKNLEEMK